MLETIGTRPGERVNRGVAVVRNSRIDMPYPIIVDLTFELGSNKFIIEIKYNRNQRERRSVRIKHDFKRVIVEDVDAVLLV
jgi:hypothetical protein